MTLRERIEREIERLTEEISVEKIGRFAIVKKSCQKDILENLLREHDKDTKPCDGETKKRCRTCHYHELDCRDRKCTDKLEKWVRRKP